MLSRQKEGFLFVSITKSELQHNTTNTSQFQTEQTMWRAKPTRSTKFIVIGNLSQKQLA